MSKRGFVRGVRTAPPLVPPTRVLIQPPLELPEREPRNILLMIAAPALLVGILAALVVLGLRIESSDGEQIEYLLVHLFLRIDD